MCLGASTRVSQGGSIAVLRPTQNKPGPSDTDDALLLLFSNQFAYPGTRVEFQGWGSKDEFKQDRHWVVIHRDGDLSGATQEQHTPLSPLFSFPLDSRSEDILQLSQRLDLGVGESGVIGRRVSVMTGSIKGPRTVAEGIMGWN